MKKLLLFFFGLVLFTACEKVEELQDDEYFIFGTYNGFCGQNCTTLFKVEDESLFADDLDRYWPGQELKFEEVPLSEDKYNLAKDAFEKLPTKLLDSSEMSFGCPGCVDQDIILLVYFDGADEQIWQVDTDIDMIPEYLQDYASDILELVNKLQE
jgi:ferredoxin